MNTSLIRALPAFAAAVLTVGVASASSEGISATQGQQIDALFAQYADPARPGCAVGVMRNGQVAHAKGYGLADVERGVPITSATVFDIGSTSKQFAAAAAILLELDGKLSLSDDVRKYVPELPDYGRAITIDHLLRHTSGLRDYTALLSLSGLEVEEVTTDEQALAVIARQRALNFPTGTRWEYSNSGFFLLAVIVERVSGKPLGEFARERIFQPLGMKSAQFRDQHAEVIPGRALGYAVDGEAPEGTVRFKNALSNWEQTGDGALHLSIEDLVKWDENFYQPRVGGQSLIDRLTQRGQLDNGEKVVYGRGLFLDEYRGLPRVHHAGNWVGYNAMLARFPEQHTSVAVLCNFEGAEASDLSEKVADVVLADVLKPAVGAPTTAAKKTAAKPVPPQRFVGSYFAAKTETILEVIEQQGALILKIGAMPLPLVATGPASFEVQGYPVKVAFSITGKQAANELRLRIGDDDEMPATRFTAAVPSAEELQGYVGTFHSPELDVTWPLVIDEGKLAVRDERRKFETRIQPLAPAMKDAFSGEAGLLRFSRDASGKVTGFELSASRMRGIRFELRPTNR
ncbi:serine hydrolase domain-containing protein [Peristeroidobacter agariperforans]|uniref:serine hydrolase domain-containing protein n=1 Tax=Peristeroidobacter agariperforans TaxID=268404 RepID=UPI0013005F2F|nr:serine hydrolase domain-containing protein [Peristeroidobacter agariperforans]